LWHLYRNFWLPKKGSWTWLIKGSESNFFSKIWNFLRLKILVEVNMIESNMSEYTNKRQFGLFYLILKVRTVILPSSMPLVLRNQSLTIMSYLAKRESDDLTFLRVNLSNYFSGSVYCSWFSIIYWFHMRTHIWQFWGLVTSISWWKFNIQQQTFLKQF
jgi:hypothetical protein